jgi:hypothetical protein
VRQAGSSRIVFDGARLSVERDAPGRRFRLDPACLADGEGAPAFAHVCALIDPDAKLPFDTTEVQQVRRDALAWWIPLLGEDFVCVTTLALDSVHYGGAITVARTPDRFTDDPFARVFPGTVVPTRLFQRRPAPPGPPIERYAGVAWPGGAFTYLTSP